MPDRVAAPAKAPEQHREEVVRRLGDAPARWSTPRGSAVPPRGPSAPPGCRSGTAGWRSGSACARRAGWSGWSSRTCRSGSARSSPTTKTAIVTYGSTSHSRMSGGGQCSLIGGLRSAHRGAVVGRTVPGRPAPTGGPCVAMLRHALGDLRGRARGSVATTASHARGRRGSPSDSRAVAQQPDRPRVLGEQGVAGQPVTDGGELQHDREVVGELGVAGVEAGVQVGLLEVQDRHPAVAGVAVGPVRQVRAGLAPHVEDRDVVPRRTSSSVRARRASRGTRSAARRVGGGRSATAAPDVRQPVPASSLVGVPEQPGSGQPGHRVVVGGPSAVSPSCFFGGIGRACPAARRRRPSSAG